MQPPDQETLARLKQRRRCRGTVGETIEVRLKTTTPVFGGGVETGQIDHSRPIRVPSIRGQLRFWWRALRPAGESPEAMRAAEQRVWGGVGDGQPQASPVSIAVGDITQLADDRVDESAVNLATVEGYVLWPTRIKGDREKGLPRLQPGFEFTLVIDLPVAHREEVVDALRAWILFGGYGSRTRRGLGSLTVCGADQQQHWLPEEASAAALNTFFNRDIFATSSATADETPRLAGSLVAAMETPSPNARGQWRNAIELLKDFRQKPEVAREAGADSSRPGRSRWPEADKVRQLVGRKTGHEPRHNNTPAWPRAGFGLPIVGQFQQQRRDKRFYEPSEPKDFTIQWRSDEGVMDRLASPLILKPLPLQNDRFAAVAIWLNRAEPPGEVVVKVKDRQSRLTEEQQFNRSAAPFDRLVAEGDDCLVEPLQGATSLRDAFVGWVCGKQGWRRLPAGGTDA